MAKKKDSLALFEVMQKTGQQGDAHLRVPGWMGAEEGPDQETPTPQRPQVKVQEVVVQAPRQGPALPSRPTGPAPAPAGKLAVSLPTLGIVAGVGVLLLAAAFYAGSALAGPAPAEPQPQADPFAPADGKLKLLIVEVMAGPTAANHAEAMQMVTFLLARGEPATIHAYTDENGPKTLILLLRPLDSADDPMKDAYARRIEELGKEYYQKYETRYAFSQREPDGTLAPRLVQLPVQPR